MMDPYWGDITTHCGCDSLWGRIIIRQRKRKGKRRCGISTSGNGLFLLMV
jgi:hypothetical protein